MSDDLRTRLAHALASTPAVCIAGRIEVSRHGEGPDGHSYHGGCALCRGEIETLLDAIMPIAEQARDISNTGQCRRCGRHVDQSLIPPHWNRQAGPHRMECRWYVGPVEHAPLTGPGASWQVCICGADLDEHGQECPNAAETWRGTVPPREEVR